MVNLDFDTIRDSLKSYLAAQDVFSDYDFEGSNISVLLDLLAQNTFLNAYYLNMVGNEGFLDSAQIRDSIASHAKELNYLPRSFSSAVAEIDISVNTGNTSLAILTMPKGTSFTSRVGSNTFTFSTSESILLEGENGIFGVEGLSIYEGQYFSDVFVYNSSNTSQKFILSNPTIDTSSLTVTVIEDSGANVLSYTAADSLFGYGATSKVFFKQLATNDRYEILFGDGVIGRVPKDNATIVAEYRISNGELPNGAFKFTADGSIGGYSNVTITTATAARGGSVSEDNNSIKYNAPRHFTTQERAIIPEDYENLLRLNFPEIGAVSAYGGEEASPPQYGKVFVSVNLTDLDGLPKSKELVYKKFLKDRSSLSIDPVFISPDYLYVAVNSTVKYNINRTTLNPDDIKSQVVSAIVDYRDEFLQDFKTTLRYSQMIKDIDAAHDAIISNETEVFAMKKFTPIIGVEQNLDLDFKIPLINTLHPSALSHDAKEIHAVYSNQFIFQDQYCNLEDDGLGNLRLVATKGVVTGTVKTIGTVDYDTGLVQITGLKVDRLLGSNIKVYVRTRNKDIASTKNTILSIDQSDINITIEQIRE